jgi:O-antigen/teichoic acid export membrane protein
MSSTLKKNTFFAAITNGSDMLQFVVMLLAARLLQPYDYGKFCWALSLAITFMTFSNFGLNTLAIRDVSRKRSVAPEYLANILSWKIVLAVIAFSLLLLYAFPLAGDPRIRMVAAILGAALMLRFFALTGRCFLHAHERFDVESIAVVSQAVVLLAGGIFVLLKGYGVIGLAIVWLVARAAECLLIFSMLNRFVPFGFRFDRSLIFKLQIQALPIGIALLIMTFYIHIDTLILERLADFSRVGLYSAAFKVYTGLFLIPSTICTVLLPRFSDTYGNKKKTEFNRLLVYGVLSLGLLSIPILVVGFLLVEPAFRLVFGEAFVPAVPTMKVLLVVSAVTFQVWLLRIILVAVDRQKVLMYFNLAGLAVRVIADLILISLYGIIDAAYATLISEVILFAGVWVYIFMRLFKVESLQDGLMAARVAFSKQQMETTHS